MHARLDWCHKVSREIANKYDVAYLEDLKIKNMTASAKGTAEAPGKHVKAKSRLNRSMLDTGWGIFERCLSYKNECREGTGAVYKSALQRLRTY